MTAPATATIYLDSHYNIITGQMSECMECQAFFPGIPLGFIYDDPSSGWRQSYEAPYIVGYCKPCARDLATRDHQEYVNGNWNARDMEDERWAR